MKLNDWARLTGIKYPTAHRWFKNGKLPVPAYQTESGTIIVQDESLENTTLSNEQSNDVISNFLKKTVEFSKNNASIEDFAAYILSNFSLKLKDITNNYSMSYKSEELREEAQKHIQKFIKSKSEKPKPNMFIMEQNQYDKLPDNLIYRSKENIDEVDTSSVASDLVKPSKEELELVAKKAETLLDELEK